MNEPKDYDTIKADAFKCEIDLYEARDERDMARVSNAQLQAENEQLRAALYHFIDDDIENNDDPSYTDPFWYLKDKPFYPLLVARTLELSLPQGGK